MPDDHIRQMVLFRGEMITGSSSVHGEWHLVIIRRPMSISSSNLMKKVPLIKAKAILQPRGQGSINNLDSDIRTPSLYLSGRRRPGKPPIFITFSRWAPQNRKFGRYAVEAKQEKKRVRTFGVRELTRFRRGNYYAHSVRLRL